MEEDIQNYSQTVMFRGTPCSNQVSDISIAIHVIHFWKAFSHGISKK